MSKEMIGKVIGKIAGGEKTTAAKITSKVSSGSTKSTASKITSKIA